MSVRGILSGALALIALQVLTQAGPSGKVAGGLGVITTIIQKALSPDVAAIPDHSRSTTSTSTKPATVTKKPATQNGTISQFV